MNYLHKSVLEVIKFYFVVVKSATYQKQKHICDSKYNRLNSFPFLKE